MINVTSAKILVEKDNLPQVNFSLRRNAFCVDILDDSVVSDFLDLNFIREVFEERSPAEGKRRLFFQKPMIITYKGRPLAELYPDGTKKLHPVAGVHLGLRLLVHRIVNQL